MNIDRPQDKRYVKLNKLFEQRKKKKNCREYNKTKTKTFVAAKLKINFKAGGQFNLN